MAPRAKLYAFADETGQDTGGSLFLVAVVVTTSEQEGTLRERFLRLEELSRRVDLKWGKSHASRRAAFIDGLPPLAALGTFYWRQWVSGTDYHERTAEAVASAILATDPEAQVTILIDGLKRAERIIVTRVLRARGVHVRRMPIEPRDESIPLLRLADALAGFLRDVLEDQRYTRPLWPKVQDILHEL